MKYKDKNVNEISNALAEKMRSFETITKEELDEFRKKMKEHLLNLKK
tara:strand:- start:428 stop:568 length:141 start_codon:yes stop_codon:yes gene_type:complete